MNSLIGEVEILPEAERFFLLCDTLNDSKVKIVSLHLDRKARQWYQLFNSCLGSATWEEFIDGFLSRFTPQDYDNADDKLSKILQITTVAE